VYGFIEFLLPSIPCSPREIEVLPRQIELFPHLIELSRANLPCLLSDRALPCQQSQDSKIIPKSQRTLDTMPTTVHGGLPIVLGRRSTSTRYGLLKALGGHRPGSGYSAQPTAPAGNLDEYDLQACMCYWPHLDWLICIPIISNLLLAY
jgi:hypothetical protein